MPIDHTDGVAALAACFLRLIVRNASSESEVRAISESAGHVLALMCIVFKTDADAVQRRAEQLLPAIDSALSPTVH